MEAKAKIISTGRIIKVLQCDTDFDKNECIFENVSNTRERYYEHELEFIDGWRAQFEKTAREQNKAIDWEQRRFELVKEIVPVIIQNLYNSGEKGKWADIASSRSVEVANAVIEKLKKIAV